MLVLLWYLVLQYHHILVDIGFKHVRGGGPSVLNVVIRVLSSVLRRLHRVGQKEEVCRSEYPVDTLCCDRDAGTLAQA